MSEIDNSDDVIILCCDNLLKSLISYSEVICCFYENIDRHAMLMVTQDCICWPLSVKIGLRLVKG